MGRYGRYCSYCYRAACFFFAAVSQSQSGNGGSAMSGELHVQNLGKSYRQWGSEWRRVASWFLPFIRPREEHWVLKDVRFSVGPGEAVGIVGQNGAGKSTLLKLITGTTSPNSGSSSVAWKRGGNSGVGHGFQSRPYRPAKTLTILLVLWAIAKLISSESCLR